MDKPFHYASLLQHVAELKKRILYAAIAYAIGLCICGYFASEIFAFLVHPLTTILNPETHRLIYTNLSEGFMTLLQVTLWSAFVVAFPLIAAQLWIFIAPGLFAHEKRAMLPFFFGAPVLFLAGAALAYFVIIPTTWQFFLSFEGPPTPGSLPIQFEGRIGEYLNFTLRFILAFGVAFQLPLVLLLLGKVGIITSEHLKKFRRYAIILIFVAAAILTPSPDMFGQTAMAIPLLILYELSIWLVKRAEKTKALRDAEAENIDVTG